MTAKNQLREFLLFVSQMESVLISKAQDYSNGDRLSNFKLTGAICGLSPEKNCLSLIATKIARLGVLLDGKTPKNESISDSVLDAANYLFLLHCIIKDGNTVPCDEADQAGGQ